MLPHNILTSTLGQADPRQHGGAISGVAVGCMGTWWVHLEQVAQPAKAAPTRVGEWHPEWQGLVLLYVWGLVCEASVDPFVLALLSKGCFPWARGQRSILHDCCSTGCH